MFAVKCLDPSLQISNALEALHFTDRNFLPGRLYGSDGSDDYISPAFYYIFLVSETAAAGAKSGVIVYCMRRGIEPLLIAILRIMQVCNVILVALVKPPSMLSLVKKLSSYTSLGR